MLCYAQGFHSNSPSKTTNTDFASTEHPCFVIDYNLGSWIFFLVLSRVLRTIFILRPTSTTPCKVSRNAPPPYYYAATLT